MGGGSRNGDCKLVKVCGFVRNKSENTDRDVDCWLVLDMLDMVFHSLILGS